MEEVHHLLAGPVLVVDAGVDHQTDGPLHVAIEPAIVGKRILVEAHVLAEPLRIEGPALHERGVGLELAERGYAVEFLGNGDLQMMARQPFVVSHGLHFVEVALRGVIGIDVEAAGPAAVGSAGLVVRGRRGFFQVVRNRNDLELCLGQSAK